MDGSGDVAQECADLFGVPLGPERRQVGPYGAVELDLGLPMGEQSEMLHQVGDASVP